jgi:type IV pilus assembly protein PilO
MALPAFLEPIANAPQWQKLGLAAIGLAAILAMPYFLLISPATDRISALTVEHESVQRELAQARRDVADMERLRREIVQLEQTIAVIKDKLPTEREMPALFRTVSDAAFQSGLAVALFQPGPPKIVEYYTEVPITVNGEGGFHQLGEFMERLAGLPRVVNVSDWRLTGLAKGSRTLKADLTLATYVYRPVGSPPPPKAPGGQPGPPGPPRPR